MKLTAALLIALLLAAAAAEASKAPRNTTERYRFQRDNPCPANGAPRGPCPGYRIDHVVPLCEKGADHRSNMQWLTVEEHRRKNLAELARCRPAGPGRRKGAQ